MLASCEAIYPGMVTMINILFYWLNADVERCFSTMRLLKLSGVIVLMHHSLNDGSD
jgi:hypothetical protein